MALRKEKTIRVILLTLLVVAILFGMIERDYFSSDTIELWLHKSGDWGPIIFIAIYAISAVFFLPAWILTTLAGALFGPWWGTLYAITGATIGATLSFLTARHLAADFVEKRVGDGRLAKIKEGVEQEGWRFVAFTRIVPLFPYNLLNYSFGLTRIKLWDFLWPTALFMLPGGFAYVYLGYVGSESITDVRGSITLIISAIAVVAIVAYIPRIVKKMKKSTTDESE